MKRAFDLVASTLLLIVLVPVLLTVAVLVRARLGAPVFFRQRRPGRCGRLFTLIKFRTMRVPGTDAADESDASRLGPFGRWLRSTSLDELPGLWNVLKGDMSLVGPRPLLAKYLQRYTPEQARRHEVRPGLAGWAQVNGRNALTWEERLRLDVWYVDNRSTALDLKILARTVGMVFSRKGISFPGEVTMHEFRGDAHHRGGAASGRRSLPSG